MSETDSNDETPDETYTVQLNNKEYALNEDIRRRIQHRAEHEYDKNPSFSCWWRVGTADDAANDDTVHEEGDPILVIETGGPMVPWEKLDQLELEMQDVSAYDEFDGGSSDVDSGSGMKTVKPGEVDPNGGSDDKKEMSRTHFEVTPRDFEDVPSPDGEDGDKIPPKPETFDEPTMVVWAPESAEITHSWAAGEAITPMHNWVEWNVQQKANQPRLSNEKQNSHDHWESLLKMDDCQVVGELKPKQSPPSKEEDSSDDDDVPQHFTDGKRGGNNWNI